MIQLDLSASGATESIEVTRPVLRPYQVQGLAEVKALIQGNCKRILFVAPTGAGKTVCAARMIEGLVSVGYRVLFMAHRIELINQTAKQLARFGVTNIGVIMGGDRRANPKAPVQVASIDTLRNRKPPCPGCKDIGKCLFPNRCEMAFDVIMIDEAHRAESNTYKVIQERYSNAISIGFTATPFRLDGKGLGGSYDEMVVVARPSLLIAEGAILCPTIYTSPELPDLSEVARAMSDYSMRGAGAAMSKPRLMGHVVNEWKRHANGRRTVAFCTTVEHAKAMAESLSAEGVSSGVVHAGTPPDVRALTLQKLRDHQISVVCNVDVLTEGWDQPEVKVAILARPTMSLRIHLQQCGRILRPFEGQGALILDHAGNCLRHGLPQQDRDYSLVDGDVTKKASNLAVKVCKKCFCTFVGTRCPECGWVNETEGGKVIGANEAVQLQEIDATHVFTLADEQRLFFQKQMIRAKENGFKPGFAAMKWKEKYGTWPPRTWTSHAAAAHAGDQAWKDRQAANEWRKQAYASRERVEEPMQTPGGFTANPDEE